MAAVNKITPISRRHMLKAVAIATALAPLALCKQHTALAADGPLVNPDDAAAKAVNYVADARQAKSATTGSSCANCALYLGAAGSAQGPCQIFAGRQVKAAGWCSSWAPQM
jgi:hypothetical protein